MVVNHLKLMSILSPKNIVKARFTYSGMLDRESLHCERFEYTTSKENSVRFGAFIFVLPHTRIQPPPSDY